MKPRLRILHLEDDAMDVELIQHALQQGGLCADVTVVQGRADFLASIEEQFDVILSDNRVPGFDGSMALQEARAKWPEIPFIFVSGFANQQQAAEKQASTGASACVTKSTLENLTTAIMESLRKETKTETPPATLPGTATERLLSVVQELSLARSLDRITAIIRRAARDLTGADGATFVLREGNQCFYADEESIAPLWKGQRFPMSACVSGWVMLNREAVVIEDIYKDPRVPTSAYRSTFVKSMVMVPVRKSSPVGAIGTYWATQRAPRADEVRLLQALADSTSITMENVQLYADLERKVADRTARLQQANQELETFSYSVSHDLRAPLRHVEGFLERLRDHAGPSLDSTSLRYLATISESARRMDALIDHLLEFSRMGRAAFRWSRVNMNALVAEVREELKFTTGDRAVRWEVSELPEIDGDRDVLRQVWINLLSNALKYTRQKANPVIRIGCAAGPNEVEYFVEDNGAGFDMQHVDRLFGVFERLHRADEFEGTGIGLANVRRIIHRHGGRTWAEGAVGTGATFYFTLPRQAVKAP
ncbi:MAG TPA: ATP-binding protein [Verrucomicrobiae bacterium]|nr:ATP-binding protein [Verrucomicrobiae bacterium]